MARSHAKIHVSIWDDTDFLALDRDARTTYLFVLSQQKMRSCGVIDVRVRRWAPKLGITVDELDRALDRLETAGFIVIDHDTDELAVRTFVKHDSGDTKNPKVWIGVWSSLGAVESPFLRAYVAFHMPEGAYDPRSKASMKRPDRIPTRTHPDYQSDRESDRQSDSDTDIDPDGNAIPSGISLSSTDSYTSTATGPDPAHEPLHHDQDSTNGHGGGGETSRPERVEALIERLADLELADEKARGRKFDRPERVYRGGIVARLRREDAPALHQLCHEHPGLSIDQLADWYRSPAPLDSLDDLVPGRQPVVDVPTPGLGSVPAAQSEVLARLGTSSAPPDDGDLAPAGPADAKAALAAAIARTTTTTDD